MGDGVMYFFLADLIVDPEFRGGGHGDRLMRLVTDYFDRNAKPGASITLVPLNGRELFYERFGFVRCPSVRSVQECITLRFSVRNSSCRVVVVGTRSYHRARNGAIRWLCPPYVCRTGGAGS